MASITAILPSPYVATKLLKLNPVAALLSRKHTDASLEMALKQSTTTPPTRSQPEVTMILHPDITKAMLEDLDRHGGILQLPPMPSFTEVKVTTNTILLQWETSDQNGSDIASDRTVTFSLHCFANQSRNLKSKVALRQMLKPAHSTPESGFEDMAENPTSNGNDLKVKFPPLLPSLVTDRRVQLIADPSGFATKGAVGGNAPVRGSYTVQEPQGELDVSESKRNEKTEPKAGQTESSEANASNSETRLPPGDVNTGARKGSTSSTSVGLKQKPTKLNLPPLIVSKPPSSNNSATGTSHAERTSSPAYSWTDTILESATSDLSEVTPVPPTPSQGLAGDEGSTPDPSGDGKTSSTSSVESETASTHETDYTNLGRYCKGYAYEEIYSGDKQSFHYSGLVPGAIYYFRVRSHNAAGWGPWSDTIKCTTRYVYWEV